jgi:hypothetical protein
MTAPGPANAQDDFIASALQVIDRFHTESRLQLKDLKSSGAVASFHKKSLKSKESAAKDIETLRWIEKPGPRRFKLVYSRVDSYTEMEIDSVGRLAAEVSADDRPRVERTAKRLRALKKTGLERLGKSLPLETYKRAEPQPVPIIDRAPFEKEPTKGDGIWYR